MENNEQGLSASKLHNELLMLKYLLEAGLRQANFITDHSDFQEVSTWIALRRNLKIVLDDIEELEALVFPSANKGGRT